MSTPKQAMPPKTESPVRSASCSEIPRRNRMDLWSPAERAIFEAIQAVESVGAHPLLTQAVVMLGKARDRVSDFIDGRAVSYQCCHGIHAGNASMRCIQRAKWVSTFNGSICTGDDGLLAWCDDHKPQMKPSPHGVQALDSLNAELGSRKETPHA